MYCGDETGSFIGDVGANTARFGYGGEDAPKYVVPAHVGCDGVVPTTCYHYRQADADLKSALRQVGEEDAETAAPITDPNRFLQQGDSIADWDAYQQLWQSAFDAMNVQQKYKHTTGGSGTAAAAAETTTTTTTTTAASGVDSSTVRSKKHAGEGSCVHPLLAVSPGCTHKVGTKYDAAVHRKEMIHLTELFMETLDCQALFIAPTPMLAAFSHGRQTTLVVDIGASGCRVTPVVDGLVLHEAQRRNGRGGDWLGNVQWQALLSQNIVVRPRYQVLDKSDKVANPAFYRWAMQDLMYEFRSSEHVELPKWWYDPTVPFLYDDKDRDDALNEDDNNKMDTDDAPLAENSYELPDGTLVDLSTRSGKDLCRVAELLFSQQLPFSPKDSEASSSILSQHATLSDVPLPQLIHSSLSAVGDVDVRKELAGSILLTGGSSVIPNLEQRLSLELTRTLSAAYKPKVLASRHSIERQCAAWIGGSVLTSLGSFQQLWLSKTEYEEYGGTLAVQRFP